MKISLRYTFLFILFACSASAQQANGKLNSLLSAENYFSSLVKTKGLNKAFLKVSDEGTMVYRPDPTLAKPFYEQKTDVSAVNLSWTPVFARIAKSGDWGFTSGPFIAKATDQPARYGQYLSVWKVNNKGIWKLALDLGVGHPLAQTEPELDFKDPKNAIYFHQRSVKRLQQREDVVLVNDRLFSTTLSSQGSVAYREFLSDRSRLLFPGFEPIIGKEKIMQFWEQHPYLIRCEPIGADRSISGDWAYTQGKATLSMNQTSQSYYYVRIWELQQGFNWNLVLEIFTPAAN